MPQMKGELVTPEEIAGDLDEDKLGDLPPIPYDLFEQYASPKYGAADMLRVCALAVIEPTKKVAALTGVPMRTIQDWRQNAPWWKEATKIIRKAKQDELDAGLTAVIHKATEEVKDRLEKGEVIYDFKTGEEARVKMKSMDIAKVLGITFDKRQLLRGDPTARSVTDSTEGVLQELKDTFTAIARGNMNPTLIEDADFEEIPDGTQDETLGSNSTPVRAAQD